MNKKIRQLLEKYDIELAGMNVPVQQIENQCGDEWAINLKDNADRMGHARWMISEMLEIGEDWSDYKTNRWLGFVQSIIWCTKLRGISELRDDNRNLYN